MFKIKSIFEIRRPLQKKFLKIHNFGQKFKRSRVWLKKILKLFFKFLGPTQSGSLWKIILKNLRLLEKEFSINIRKRL